MATKFPTFAGSVLLAIAFASPGTSAQDVLWDVSGQSFHEQLGQSLETAGDVNGDGFSDVIIGSPQDGTNGNGAGKVQVVSGLDGSVLLSGLGPAPSAFLGASVSTAGDVNGDGHADLIVGAPGDYRALTPPGAAYVVSGFNGQLLHLFVNPDGQRFGSAVSGAGDVNADGFADLIVGAPRRANLAGAALVYSGLDGAELHQLLGESPLDYMGSAVSSAGEIDRDGHADLIVGGRAGYAQVFSGASGLLIYASRRGFPHEGYGMSVDEIEDLDYDGSSELIVGAPGGAQTGRAYVLSGRRGDLKYLLEGEEPGEQFGADVSGAGDLNGDGFEDFLVGRPLAVVQGSTVGGVRAFSGYNGLPLYNWFGETFEWFGRSVAGAGDLNGDGLDDLVVAAPLFDSLSHEDAGRVTAYAGNDLFLEAFPPHPALGDVLTLAVRQNAPFRPVLLAIVELNGTPTLLPLVFDHFDFDWAFEVSETLPPGLAGVSLSIRAFSKTHQGALPQSSDVHFAF